MGVTECDNMLMLLGISVKFNKRQTDIVTPLLIQGFVGKHFKLLTSYDSPLTLKFGACRHVNEFRSHSLCG